MAFRAPGASCIERGQSSLELYLCWPELEPSLRFRDHVFDDLLQIVGFLENFELALGAVAPFEHGPDVFDFAPAIELVEHVVHELEVFEHQLLGRALPVSRPKSISLPSSP